MRAECRLRREGRSCGTGTDRIVQPRHMLRLLYAASHDRSIRPVGLQAAAGYELTAAYARCPAPSRSCEVEAHRCLLMLLTVILAPPSKVFAMSVAAKRTLFGSVVFCALTIAGVHYGQIQESEVRPPAQPARRYMP